MSAPDVALVGPYPANGALHAGRSGVASYTANLARALDTNGARVVAVADEVRGEPAVTMDGGIRVVRAFARGALALPRARAAALATGAPVVHVQHELFLYGGAASVPGLLPGLAAFPAPLVVTMHQVVEPRAVDGSFARMHRVRVPSGLARLGIGGVQSIVRSCADAVIVHERALATLLGDAVVIPHGVERVQRVDRDEARAALGLGERFVAICFGFIAPYKGLETALRAAAIAGPSVQLVVAGDEHPRLAGRDGYAQRLRASADGNVRFTGYVSEEDVSLWFSAADLALLPYPRPFSSSGALALALGYGTPAMLSRELAACVGASADMAVERDPQVLADRLRSLAASPRELERLGAATAALARDRSWPHVATRHLDLYEEVIRGHGAPRRRVRAAQPG